MKEHMERQELLYMLLGIAMGAIFTSILFLRAPLASERAYELGIRKKVITELPQKENIHKNQSESDQ
jgi:hypothetical protein